jgi:hypothetical protein
MLQESIKLYMYGLAYLAAASPRPNGQLYVDGTVSDVVVQWEHVAPTVNTVVLCREHAAQTDRYPSLPLALRAAGVT